LVVYIFQFSKAIDTLLYREKGGGVRGHPARVGRRLQFKEKEKRKKKIGGEESKWQGLLPTNSITFCLELPRSHLGAKGAGERGSGISSGFHVHAQAIQKRGGSKAYLKLQVQSIIPQSVRGKRRKGHSPVLHCAEDDLTKKRGKSENKNNLLCV